MKKTLLLTFCVLTALSFSSCGSDDELIDDNTTENEETKNSIVGVWGSDDYFVSFSDDGFYAAYLSDEFIDSGSYKYEDNTVTCENPYFNRTTTYQVKKLADGKMYVDIAYVNNHGNSENASFEFVKSDIAPASKEHTLMGKSATIMSAYFDRVTYAFNTINSGVKSATGGSAKKYPLNFFYIYIEDRLYFQILQPTMTQVPTIGGWSNQYNEVQSTRVKFSSNGSISGFASINS